MNIILKQLKIRNFKGIKEFNFLPNEKITSVFGENGAGKTTLYDAFSWLLFGKNSNDQADFGIKPIDSFGEVIPQLETEVEGELVIDGKTVLLTRTLIEKWVTRRGSKDKTFDGNETNFKFDEVPVSKTEFKKRIDSIISEEAFKMITNLNYFNDMHWKKKRESLFEIAGETSDQEIENYNPDLAGFVAMLDGKGLDDFKKMIAAKIKKIKDEKKSIPIRVDEVDRNKPAVPEFSEAELNENIDQLNEVIKETDRSLSDIKNRNKTNDDVIKNINDLKMKAANIENDEKRKSMNSKNDLQNQLNSHINIINSRTRDIDYFKKDQRTIQGRIDSMKKNNDIIRQEYSDLKNEVFVAPDKDSNDFKCNCCGQMLPTDNIEETINNLKVKFDDRINKRRNEIRSTGGSNKQKIEQFESDIKLIEEKIKAASDEIAEANKNKEHFEKLIAIPVVEKSDFTDVTEWVTIQKEIGILNASIKDNEDSSKLIAFRNETSDNIQVLKDLLKTHEDIKRLDNRKVQILSSEQKLIDELVEFENQEFKCETFMRTKVDLLDEKVNSKFKFVRFKMFNTQVNGAVAETCEALVNTNGCWVPYKDANTAGQINAGLDIVNTLANHYGIEAPIFIDHNESVTKVIESDSQIIGLFVSTSKGLEVK